MLLQREQGEAAPRPPSVLLSANFPPLRGGTARLFWELYRRAPPRRVRVITSERFARSDFSGGPPLLDVRGLGAPFPAWPLFSIGGPVGYRAASRALDRDLRATPARALHAARLLPEGWLARGSGLRYACWVHGEELNSIGRSRQLTWMARRVLAGATLSIANSEHTASLLTRWFGIDAGRIRVVHPGVDCAWFHPAEPDAAARAELGWGARPVILTVARLQERKGHLQLLDALAPLVRYRPDLLWAVVGDGEMRAAIERRIAETGLGGHVLLHGELDERRLLLAYQQCDLFVLPNVEVGGDFEGFGMVLLEAQACGRAAIAGASGGTGEAIFDGETGFLVDCTDRAALSGALGRLLDAPDERRVMGERGRRRASTFDWTLVADRALEIWNAHDL
jgi:phosphatidylinositol alpha-1,6-mannosyltransferase